MNQDELTTYFTVLGLFEPDSTYAHFTDCAVFVREKYVRVISADHTKSTTLKYPVSLEKLKKVIHEPS